jgi:ribose 5-phosphate isomerase
LDDSQLDEIKLKIKAILLLDTLEIKQQKSRLFFVTTNDNNIVDFKIDNYSNNKVSLEKYHTFNVVCKRTSLSYIDKYR